ncbi:hypothetical protein [Gordonia otitidis]|uniref:hypothetical protein n=1 Tax=Gordonia otitidis TaxID=249058 RepID=UPI00058656B4|nr:hypothetical protein [Gordonia otitidis]
MRVGSSAHAGGVPAVAFCEVIGQGGERGVEFHRPGRGRRLVEYAGGTSGVAAAQDGGVVVHGLQDAEPPRRSQRFTRREQLCGIRTVPFGVGRPGVEAFNQR